ncbi:tetratricopeptide repeat protein [bacterium]|nr:tetratricopeptide repeat protein [bacterium]
MTRAQKLLAAVIAVELIGGAVILVPRAGRVAPPAVDLADTDPATAADLRAIAPSDFAKLGGAYLAAGFYPEAEACYRHAAEREPAAEAIFKHGFALERLGRVEEANGRYREAIDTRHRRAADLWYYIGRNHLRLEQPNEAATAFARAGSLPAARFEEALAAARAGKDRDADAAAERLAADLPEVYPPAALRHRLAVLRGDSRAAAVRADEFARRPRPLPTPWDAEVEWVFGTAAGLGQERLFRDAGRLAQEQRFDAAEARLREALAAGWAPEVADRLAEVAFVLGRREEAERVLTDAVARGGPSAMLLWRLGQAHAALGRPGDALAAWERASRLAAGPVAEGVYRDLADGYAKAGDGEKAKRAAARADLAAGLAELTAGRPAEAAGVLARATEADPQLAHAWYALGESHRRAGRPADARAAYDRCLGIDPDHGRALRGRALLGQ